MSITRSATSRGTYCSEPVMARGALLGTSRYRCGGSRIRDLSQKRSSAGGRCDGQRYFAAGCRCSNWWRQPSRSSNLDGELHRLGEQAAAVLFAEAEAAAIHRTKGEPVRNTILATTRCKVRRALQQNCLSLAIRSGGLGGSYLRRIGLRRIGQIRTEMTLRRFGINASSFGKVSDLISANGSYGEVSRLGMLEIQAANGCSGKHGAGLGQCEARRSLHV